MFARCYNQEALDNRKQPTTLLYKSASLHKDGQEKRKRINSTYPIRCKNVMQHYAVKLHLSTTSPAKKKKAHCSLETNTLKNLLLKNEKERKRAITGLVNEKNRATLPSCAIFLISAHKD